MSFVIVASFGQDVVKGIVVDSATFSPLPFVSVHVKNKGKGTTTDMQGNFGILATTSDTLVFTLVGYERLEYPLFDYEASVIRMSERATVLKTITINDDRLSETYEGLFDDQNAALLNRKVRFYYAKSKKDRIKAGWWREDNIRVKTYVDVVINNPETKLDLMKKHSLTEEQYYETLTAFNEKHYAVMYYLTSGELISFLNRFFEDYRK
jgi:hypothetical protein